MHHLRKISVGLSLVATLALSACGSAGSSNAPATTGGSAAPASLRDGALNVFADGAYPPYEYLDKDGKTMLGMEVEMLDAISKKLGVQITYQNMQFDGMIPALANGRADLMIMGMADTDKRREQVDFIDLYKTTMRVVTQTGNPAQLTLGNDPANPDMMSLCGRKAAVTTGGQQEQTVKVLSDNCVKAGKPAIESQAYPQNTQEYLAVKNGRADFDLFVPANADYFVKNNTGYEVIPGSFPTPGARFTGWIVAKNNKELGDTLVRVINELIADGTWAQLLGKWGVTQADAVIPPLRNGQPSA